MLHAYLGMDTNRRFYTHTHVYDPIVYSEFLSVERNNLIGGGLGGNLPTQLSELTKLGTSTVSVSRKLSVCLFWSPLSFDWTLTLAFRNRSSCFHFGYNLYG